MKTIWSVVKIEKTNDPDVHYFQTAYAAEFYAEEKFGTTQTCVMDGLTVIIDKDVVSDEEYRNLLPWAVSEPGEDTPF